MKKMATALLTATLACSILPAPALAMPGAGSARNAIQAGLQQMPMAQLASSMATPAKGFQAVPAQQMPAQPATLQIREAGTYVLTGDMRGTVRVDPGQGDVTLVMDNARIDGRGAPAIQAVSGNSLTILTPGGSNSRLIGGGVGNAQMPAVQSSVNTIFEGRGSLFANGNRMTPGMQMAPNMTVGQQQMPGGNAGNGMLRTALGLGNQQQASFFGGNQQQAPAAGNQQSPNANQQQAGFSGNQQQAPSSAMGQPGQPGQSNQSDQSNQPNQPGQPGFEQNTTGSTESPSSIVTSTAQNSASSLLADLDAATYYDVSETAQVKITDAGTYVVSGTASDGNITVKKGTTGVVLVLDNLDLTSTTGATLSVNKNAEVKIVVSGNVTLTDNENPNDENSTDEAVADAYDGAALKVKAESQVYLTGEEGSTLTINGNAKNGIKVGDDASLVIDGVDMDITAANDGINANYDLTILSGDITINAEDDAIHADHILTIGDEETGEGPTIQVESSTEGLEGTVVNIFGGDIDITSSDDAINAANKDGVYEGELEYSVNMTGGDVTINSRGDGIDSNGNVNLVGGSANINSASGGGEAGIDYDGNLYVSNEFRLNNRAGVSGPDGQPGGMGGQMGQPGMGGQGGMGNQMGQPGMGGQGGMRR